MAGESRIAQALGNRAMSSSTANLQVGTRATYNPAQIQADPTAGQKESRLAKAFETAGTLIASGKKIADENDRIKEETYNPVVQRYLNENDRVGFRKLMMNNNIPEMEDPIFRKVLYRTLGTQAAFDIDKDMSELLVSGKLDMLTESEVFEMRADKVNKLRENAWESYGISAGDSIFSQGLATQVVERNNALKGAYIDRRSAIARNQAKNAFTEGANSLIRARMPAAGKALGAYVVNGYLDGLSGDVGATQGFVSQITSGMAMQGYPKEELEALWNTTLSDGTKLGSLIDAENQQKYIEFSESRRLGADVDNRAALNAKMNQLEFTEDIDSALQEASELKESIGKMQGGFATQQYAEAEALEKRLLNKKTEMLDQQRKDELKAADSKIKQSQLTTDMLAKGEGLDVNFSAAYYAASKEDKAAAAQAVNQQIDDDPSINFTEKLRRKVRLATGDPDGFFAEAMHTQTVRSSGVLRTLAAGEPVSEEQNRELATTLGFVKELPAEASQFMDSDSYRNFVWMNRSRELGLSQQATAKALLDMAESEQGSPELAFQKREEFRKMANEDPAGLKYLISNMDTTTEEDARTYWSIMRANGMPPAQAAKETNKYIKDNYYTLGNATSWGQSQANIIIPNKWLSLEGRPDEIKINQDFLTATITSKFGTSGTDNLIVSKGSGDNVITIRSLIDDSKDGTLTITKDALFSNYDSVKDSEAISMEENVKASLKAKETEDKSIAQIEKRNEWNFERRTRAAEYKEKRRQRERKSFLKWRVVNGLASPEEQAQYEQLKAE
ncbi:MAG: hypothetical protein [Caudoviricetes sp.]|nr:MAG: hypothetical protein [Caudoviricetes sp.]